MSKESGIKYILGIKNCAYLGGANSGTRRRICLWFFPSLMKAQGGAGSILGRRKGIRNAGVDLLDHLYSLGVYSHRLYRSGRYLDALKRGTGIVTHQRYTQYIHNCVTCCSSRCSPCKLAYPPGFITLGPVLDMIHLLETLIDLYR